MSPAENLDDRDDDALSGDPRVNLLFATIPLLRLMRGDKYEFLRRAWLDCAHHITAGRLTMLEDRLPTDPRDAALLLIDASVQLARAHGVSGPELREHFNERQEGGYLNSLTRADDALEHTLAVLMVLVARKLKAPR